MTIKDVVQPMQPTKHQQELGEVGLFEPYISQGNW